MINMSKRYVCPKCGQLHRVNSPMGLDHKGMKIADRDDRGRRYRPRKDDRKGGE